MKIKKSTLYLLGIFLLLVVASYALTKGNDIPSDSPIQEDSKDVQKIVLSIQNYNYYPNTVIVKAGMPVRIYLDSTVAGCYRSFTIKDFGIAKNLPTPKDYVEFTPTKIGTYKFACSMGMGTGTLIVE